MGQKVHYAGTRTIVTLTTDFGLTDAYVASLKAAVLRACAVVRLIDVTHLVPRHDILSASITLERAVDDFPPGTVHLAVVDPGVGTDRRMIVGEIKRQWVVCPDNGLLTWAWRLHPGGRCHQIFWRPRRHSHTFHGRDIMAPVAGMLAGGRELSELARPIDDPFLLDLAPIERGAPSGRIIQIDQYGNAMTNIPYDRLPKNPAVEVRIRGRGIGRLKRTYRDVPPGKPLALVGSSGLVEIAVRDGSARSTLKIRVGDVVSVK